MFSYHMESVHVMPSQCTPMPLVPLSSLAQTLRSKAVHLCFTVFPKCGCVGQPVATQRFQAEYPDSWHALASTEVCAEAWYALCVPGQHGVPLQSRRQLHRHPGGQRADPDQLPCRVQAPRGPALGPHPPSQEGPPMHSIHNWHSMQEVLTPLSELYLGCLKHGFVITVRSEPSL